MIQQFLRAADARARGAGCGGAGLVQRARGGVQSKAAHDALRARVVQNGKALPPSRTKWTRLVHPSVLTGHVSSAFRRAVKAQADAQHTSSQQGAPPRPARRLVAGARGLSGTAPQHTSPPSTLWRCRSRCARRTRCGDSCCGGRLPPGAAARRREQREGRGSAPLDPGYHSRKNETHAVSD